MLGFGKFGGPGAGPGRLCSYVIWFGPLGAAGLGAGAGVHDRSGLDGVTTAGFGAGGRGMFPTGPC